MSAVLLESLSAWWPEVILSVGGLLVILCGAWTRRAQPALAATWATLLAAAVALGRTVPPTADLFFGLIVCDPFSLVFRWLALSTTMLVVLMVMGSREVAASLRGEYLGLLLFIAVGLMVMAEANHLLMAYVGMELVSLSSYALVGFLEDRRSAEASLKYLLFGALSSAIMLFGMSLLFGLTGQLGFAAIRQSCAGLSGAMAAALHLAVLLMFAGLAFKISLVPFHMWTPDAYEGAPVPVAALLSVGPKAAGLALLARLLQALHPAWEGFAPTVLVLTVVTMTLGNVVALVQTNAKRLLAYSTIGQVGYLLIGLTVDTSQGLQGLLVYLAAYLFMNLGLFACLVAVVNETGSESVDAFRGLAGRSPMLALACALFLLSLAGIPPLLGFFGKFLLFGAAIESQHVGLAVAGILNSAVALYYYVNLIRLMYFAGPSGAKPFRPSPALGIALAVCAAATLFLGLFPGKLFELSGAGTMVNLL